MCNDYIEKNMKAGHQNGASRAVKWQVITEEVWDLVVYSTGSILSPILP